MICKYCGAENDDSKFCMQCGKPLQEEAPVAEPVYQTEPVYRAEPVYQTNIYQTSEIPEKYKPLSGWAYFGLQLLFAIPPVGWVFCFVFAVGGCRNINRRNFARSYFCWLLIVAVLAVIGVLISLLLNRSVPVMGA